jgi:hypothetical protein
MEVDPHLRTFFHTHYDAKSTIFRSVDVVLIADQFTSNANEDVQFLGKWIVAVAISHLTARELDERWLRVIERRLNLAISDTTPSGQVAGVKFVNLAWVVKEFDSASPQQRYKMPLNAFLKAGDFLMGNDASQYQDVFCDQWDKLLALASRDVVFPGIRTLYNTLHGGRNDSPIGPADDVSCYPRCNPADYLQSPSGSSPYCHGTTSVTTSKRLN